MRTRIHGLICYNQEVLTAPLLLLSLSVSQKHWILMHMLKQLDLYLSQVHTKEINKILRAGWKGKRARAG